MLKTIYSLFLLCIGYFIDFYDLTIMSAGYNKLFREQFHVVSVILIHRLYFITCNYQTAGILVGAIVSGLLADKIGRARVLKYSILIYSLSTFLVLFTHHLLLFFMLRFLSYFGLATEFSTSTVLILESFPIQKAQWGATFLYICGVLGGITATLIGTSSWRVMFLIGALAGLFLYIFRVYILESTVFTKVRKEEKYEFSNLLTILKQRKYVSILCRYLVMILPFYAVVTMIFIIPVIFIHGMPASTVIKLILLGFFAGNIASCLCGAAIIAYLKNYKIVMVLGIIFFFGLMTHFNWISSDNLFFYTFGLGLVCGGYPTAWAQQLALECDIHLRCSINNFLFAMGRATSIGYSTFSIYLVTKSKLMVWHDISIMSGIIGFFALVAIIFTPNLFWKQITK